MSFIRYKKIGNKEYAYEVIPYWDSTAQKPRQKTRYLGVVIDREKGIFIKPREKPVERLILDFGNGYMIYEYLKQTGIDELLKEVFGSNAEALKVMIAYKLCEGLAMRHLPMWYEGNVVSILSKAKSLDSQRISRLLKVFGEEGKQREFFKRYIKRYFDASEGIIIDTTALPNEIGLGLTEWGYSDSSIDMQIRLVCVVDRDRGLPVYYRYVGGSIVDVSVFGMTIEELKRVGMRSSFVLFDAGFFSETNLCELNREGIDYLIRIPSGRKVYKDLLKQHISEIEKVSNAVRYGQRVLFIKQVEVELYGKKGYAHIVLDPERKGRETKKLMIEAIEDGRMMDEALEYELSQRGIMMLFSTFPIDKDEVVPMYYMRAKIEQAFGFSKDDLRLLPLRVHKEETLRGYLFLMFLTLVVFMFFRKELKNKYTVEEAMLSMRNLKCKVYENEILISETTKQQKEILSLLNIIVPKKCGI